ncbi:MAG: hypothetical protein QXE12_04345 [Conexivisphaerales archaeon]
MSSPITTKQANIPPITVLTNVVIVPRIFEVIKGNRTMSVSKTGAATRKAVVGFLEAILKSFREYANSRFLNTSLKSLGISSCVYCFLSPKEEIVLKLHIPIAREILRYRMENIIDIYDTNENLLPSTYESKKAKLNEGIEDNNKIEVLFPSVNIYSRAGDRYVL